MKKLVIFFLFMLICGNVAHAKKVTTTEAKDGGKKVETVFEAGDNEYRYQKTVSVFDGDGRRLRDENFILENQYNNLGLEKVSKEYDRSGGLRIVEISFRPDIAIITGYRSIKLTLNAKSVKRRMEIIYTDKNLDDQIYERSVLYFDIVGKRLFARYYFTPAAAKKSGFVRFDEEYDSVGNPINQRFITDDGRVL